MLSAVSSFTSLNTQARAIQLTPKNLLDQCAVGSSEDRTPQRRGRTLAAGHTDSSGPASQPNHPARLVALPLSALGRPAFSSPVTPLWTSGERNATAARRSNPVRIEYGNMEICSTLLRMPPSRPGSRDPRPGFSDRRSRFAFRGFPAACISRARDGALVICV